MNLNRYKIILAVLLAAQNFLAVAQTTNVVAPSDYAKFIAERNIFDPDREPNVPYVSRPRTTHIVPVVRQVDAFSLVGVIGYGEGRLAGVYALFNGSSLEYQKAAQLNDSIAGFKVVGIAADSVTLVSGTNKMVLAIGEQLHNDGIGHWLYANGMATRYSNASYGSGRNSGRSGYGSRRRNNNSGNYNSGNFGNNNYNRVRNDFAPSTAASGNSQADDQNMNSQDDNTAPDDNAAPDNTASSDNTNVPDTGSQELQQTGH